MATAGRIKEGSKLARFQSQAFSAGSEQTQDFYEMVRRELTGSSIDEYVESPKILEITCKDLLNKIASLSGRTDWEWTGTRNPHQQPHEIYESGIKPPAECVVYERHSLNHTNLKYVVKHVIDELGEPLKKYENEISDSPQYFSMKEELWIYRCNDGEVRIPFLHMDGSRIGEREYLEIVRQVEVFRRTDEFTFEDEHQGKSK